MISNVCLSQSSFAMHPIGITIIGSVCPISKCVTTGISVKPNSAKPCKIRFSYFGLFSFFGRPNIIARPSKNKTRPLYATSPLDTKIKRAGKFNKKNAPNGAFLNWCRLSDLNQRPTDYKSAALPAELNRRCHPIIHI